MAILVSAHELRKAYAARPLFDEITFSIESGEKIGLIGPNGAGKSTLLRILAGQIQPDEGTLSFRRGARVGYLEQVPSFTPGATILSTIIEAIPKGAVEHDWEAQSRALEAMSKLSLDSELGLHAETLVDTLSGGVKKRVALARELVKEPDLLLLDEPTNHLDVESILWLEDFIESAPFAVMTITHDRAFLQNIANRILELDRRNENGLLSVQGSYADYLDIKSGNMAAQERREVILKNTLRRETEWLRQGAKARTTKQQARIKRAGDLKETVEDVASRNQVRSARIDFQSAERNPKKLLEAKKVSKSLGGRTLFKDFDLLLTPGTRVGLLGRNGAGKSSLIRVLLGIDPPDSGEVFRSDNLSVAYFEQNRESLDPKVTLSKTICPVGDYVDFRGGRVHVKSYLDRFLFSSGQMEMAVGKLSGGEQSRILIAKLMLNEANLLVLDEPTNDLDMATLSVLEECLTDFKGAVLLVSHDRYFLDQVSTKIVAYPGLHSFVGIDQWETWRKEAGRTSATPRNGVTSGKTPPAESVARASGKRKLSYKEQRELDSMESTIQEVESKLNALTTESERPENASNATQLAKITAEMSALQSEIERLYMRWSELSS
ncbi:MAG: ABC-F family ATP-binding cassette domain-containing protein [Oligoflexia bacterium]|nr:ABC-F family ATP-binding cassette domain-containing protein [Oligoflexia bacterium]